MHVTPRRVRRQPGVISFDEFRRGDYGRRRGDLFPVERRPMVRVDREVVLDERERETLERLTDALRDGDRAVERLADDREGGVNVRRVLVAGLRPIVRAGVRLLLLRRIVEPLERCVLPRVGSREIPPLERRVEFER